MTAVTVTTARGTTASARLAWIWPVLAVYAASRVLTTTALVIARRHQEESFPGWWGDPQPPYGVFVARWWDGWWYEQIWAGGYPATLPIADGSGEVPAGDVDINAWAFFPLYPMLVRAVTTVTGGTWLVAAPLVSLVCGAVAMLVIHRLIEVAAPLAVAACPGLPLLSVAVVSFWPAAVVFQTAYSEALALLLVATTLLLLVRRRYGLSMVAVLLLGLTRAVALPMVAVGLVHLWLRWRAHRRGEDPLPRREAVLAAAFVLVAGLSGGLWPLIAGWRTGRWDAYLATQQAWRPMHGMALFEGWTRVQGFSGWGVALAAGAVVTVVGLLVSPAGRRLGPELRTWTAAYLLYLAAVGDLISSQLRFLLLAFPLAAALAGLVRRPPLAARLWLAVLLTGLATAQVAWVWTVWMQLLKEVTFLKAP